MVKCAKCSKVIAKKTPGVQCGKCSKWFHGSCASLTTKQLSALSLTDSVDWKCRGCAMAAGKPKRISVILPGPDDEDYELDGPDHRGQEEKNILYEIREEVREMRLKVREIIREELQSTLQFYSSKIDDYEEKLHSFEIRIKLTENQVQNLSNINKNLQLRNDVLEQKLNKMEQIQISNDVEICGIAQSNNAVENIKEIVTAIAQKLDQKPEDILKAHRKKIATRPGTARASRATADAPIILTLRPGTRESWLLSARNKALNTRVLGLDGDSEVYLRPSLSPTTAYLLWKAKSDLKEKSLCKYVWCKDGAVMVRKNDGDKKIYYVKSTNDIENIKRSCRKWVLVDAWRVSRSMSGMGGASMLRTRRKDVNLKPNRKLDRKSSRGMLYENEELRLRTININAEVERGQSDIKKLKRENDQLKREISALRYEYERLDHLLRERRSSPEHSDDSASVCSACPECACPSEDSCARVAFNDLSVVHEEQEDGLKSGVESPCTCEECQSETKPILTQPMKQNTPAAVTSESQIKIQTPPNNRPGKPNIEPATNERIVDVLVHDTPIEPPKFFQSVTSPPYHSPPPPPGFVVAPHQAPRFHTGGNVEDLLGDVQSTPMHTTFIQQSSVFMCNTRKVMQRCCCQHQNVSPPNQYFSPNETQNEAPKIEIVKQNGDAQPKKYVTEKNIELTYDYPRATPILATPSPKSDDHTTTTEVASTVVFVERRIPVKQKKFDFFFRSRSAPVGENEEPIYATVNKLPKRLRRMELANLEKEVAYKSNEPDSSTRTEITLKTDSEAAAPDDDTSPSEREKSVAPKRPDSPKAKKRKRFSLTFKKRERKRREKKKDKKELKSNVPKNGILQIESDNERLIDAEIHSEMKHNKHCTRHRPRNTMSSSSSGPRYKRDSYQEMTTSHSEHERTNSVCSSMNSLGSACTHKSRKLSVPPHDGGSIPWCGCWGAGCI